MFKIILIANRGEIACRIASTATHLGIKTIGIYSQDDAMAKHVSFCDTAVFLPGVTAKETYLNIDAIIKIALDFEAQAIHPGYGFLSENPEFAERCADAGLIFIGPSPNAMRQMGLKAEAKTLMLKAGIPVVPGYQGDNQDPTFLHQQADHIGYPLLIKASAGGGGRGMRVVRTSHEFPELLNSCKREAFNSFGNANVLLERYLENPRHIEVQIFGDMHGNFVHLFERDCSLQRRHQKIIEEAPAPDIDTGTREKLCALAIEAARSVNYVGAGTVEFIAQKNFHGQFEFFFMEMNTRLQVEHPVTEAITGFDLVHWQLLIASGCHLPVSQQAITINGHAIEVRICAENPEHNFLPSAGHLQILRFPASTHFTRADIRVDSGYSEGDSVSPQFDSMIAKVICHADSRQEAIQRLCHTLDHTRIIGTHHNTQLLKRLLQSSAFGDMRFHTGFIETYIPTLMSSRSENIPLLATAFMATKLQFESTKFAHMGHHQNPWVAQDAWRITGRVARYFKLRINNILHTLTFTPRPCDYGHTAPIKYSLDIDGVSCPFSWRLLDDDLYQISLHDVSQAAYIYQVHQSFHIITPQGHAQLAEIGMDEIIHKKHDATSGLVTPMPGKILSIVVAIGDAVQEGQTLAILEAMKMEHTIIAPYSGIIQDIHHKTGDSVLESATLFDLEPFSSKLP